MSSLATPEGAGAEAPARPGQARNGQSRRNPSGKRPAGAAQSSPRRTRDNLNGWGFAAPFLAFFLVFLVWPLLYGLYMSLTGKSLTGANDSLIGLANYAEALDDAGMWRSLGNTLYFTVI